MSTETAAKPFSFLDSVKDRYGAADDTASYNKEDFLVGDSKKAKNKTWELVGMDDMRKKQSRFDRIHVISVPDSNITHAENVANEITEAKLVNATELDLSANTGLQMADIDTIVKQMPRLELLQLSNISLATTLSIPQSWNVSKLVLNFTGINSIDTLANIHLPKLEELHLDGNNLSTLKHTGDISFANVKRLSLAMNSLDSWEAGGLQECFTTVFPSLEHVSLSDNKLPDLTTVAAENLTWLNKLTSFWLSDCPNMTSTTSLDALRNAAPGLVAFRVTYKYLFPKLAEAQSRALVVASLPLLSNLNNATIRKKERMDAELFYLQRGLAESEENQQFYPLIEGLKEKYADLVLTQGAGGNASAAHVMLHLRFRMDGKVEEHKSLPSSLHVEKLKALVKAMFNVDPTKQKLFFQQADIGGFAPPIPLDNDLQTLAFFGVGTDAIIQIEDMDADK